MKISDKELRIEDIFKGLIKRDIDKIKVLLPYETLTSESFELAVENLTPDQQRVIDDFLDKAIRIQRTRFYRKRALLLSIIIMIVAIFVFYKVL